MQIIEPRSVTAKRTARHLLFLLALCWLVASVMLTLGPPAALILAFILPGALPIALLLVIKLIRAGTSPLPVFLFSGGAFFIIAGALFDIAMTVLRTPDLSAEENPIARMLLDSGHSVAFVYGFAIFAQSLYLSFLTLLWAALLRNREMTLASVRGRSSSLAPDGVRLGAAYHFFWFFAVYLIAGSIDRWYLAFEWMGLVSDARWTTLGIGVVTGLACYTVWLLCGSPHSSASQTASSVSATAQTAQIEPVDRLQD